LQRLKRDLIATGDPTGAVVRNARASAYKPHHIHLSHVLESDPAILDYLAHPRLVAMAEDLVGAEGEGWSIAGTTLSVERQGFSQSRDGGRARKLEGPIYDEYRNELAIALEPYTWYPQREGRVDLLFERALANGAIQDPGVRQELARAIGLKRAAQLAAEAAAAKRRAGQRVVPEGSIGKLAASVIARQANHVHTLISGPRAMLAGPDSELDGIVAEVLLSTPAISIAGGTDEIQKNIISERVLGFPKEPRFDTGPFRDVPRNVSQTGKQEG
jgi:hypothetical protein